MRPLFFVDVTQIRLVNFLATFRDSVSFPSFRCKLEPWEMGPIGCPETSAAKYQTTLQQHPRRRRPNLHATDACIHELADGAGSVTGGTEICILVIEWICLKPSVSCVLYREIMAVCAEIHINTVCGQNVELLNVKLALHIVTTGL